MRNPWSPKDWAPVHFDSFADVPMHYAPEGRFTPDVLTVFNSDGVQYFHNPKTDQYWIQIGFDEDEHGRLHCPTQRCDAECCRNSTPWPMKYPMGDVKPCPFLTDEPGSRDHNRCGIQGSKPICCVQAPEPSNTMYNVPKCELRCVEVRPV